MGKRLGKWIEGARSLSERISGDHVGAYAAQSAYFFMLCMIPMLLLFLLLVQYTPVTRADVMTAVVRVFPSSVEPLLLSVVNQVYERSAGVLPLTILAAVWSAGRGALCVGAGLNTIYGCKETRGYLFLRVRAALYTLLFILAIWLLLLLSVFGNSLNLFISRHIRALKPLSDWLIHRRVIITPAVITGVALLIYRFLPNRRGLFREQAAGALFAAVWWLAVSWVFSVYVDIFKGFSSMYGSLTTIVLIMLWLYFCMYGLLLGGELNKYLGALNGEERGQP